MSNIVVKAAERMGVELKCNICGSTESLVRDHDHRTNMIRGILCELCNNWLGVYEANLRRIVEKGKKNYRKWVAIYFDKIEAHLKCNSGIPYLSPRKLLKLKKRTEGGHALAGVPRVIKGVRFC